MTPVRWLLGRRYRRIPEDDFICRLPSSVIGSGMLHPGNLFLMDRAIREMPSRGCVLEIGTYGGLSANLICHLAAKHGRTNRFFTCDPWIYEGRSDRDGRPVDHIDGRPDLKRTAYMRHIKQSYIAATRLLSAERLPYTIEATSAEFFARWDREEEICDVFGRAVTLGGTIAFAYIDGDHSPESVARDFSSVAANLEPGGLVLLDDSAGGPPFGHRAMMRPILTRSEFKVVARNPNYLLRKSG